CSAETAEEHAQSSRRKVAGRLRNAAAANEPQIAKLKSTTSGTALCSALNKRSIPFYRSCFFFQAEDGIRDRNVTGVQTCALPIWAFPVEEAFQDPQAGALSEYIGKEEVTCDYTRMPLLLQPEDALLLCSDGVSDTLTLKQIREAMALSSQACCDKLEEEILAAGKPGQDNYTAIALKYHGKNEEES